MNPLPQSTRNAAEPWTAKEVRQFEKLAAENLPPCVISLRLGRPIAAILTPGRRRRTVECNHVPGRVS